MKWANPQPQKVIQQNPDGWGGNSPSVTSADLSRFVKEILSTSYLCEQLYFGCRMEIMSLN